MTDRLIEEWFTEATPEECTVEVCFDRKLLAEFEQCVAEHEDLGRAQAGMMTSEEAYEALARRIVDLNERIKADKAKHTFRFAKAPYHSWRAILDSNPPTDAQRGIVDFDPHRAAPAMIAVSCKHPDLTVGDAEKLRELLPEGEFTRLFEAALQVNRTGVVIPKAVSSIVDHLASELRSTTPASTGSPSASCEDESSHPESPSGSLLTSNGSSAGRKSSGRAARAAGSPATKPGAPRPKNTPA